MKKTISYDNINYVTVSNFKQRYLLKKKIQTNITKEGPKLTLNTEGQRVFAACVNDELLSDTYDGICSQCMA